MKQEVVRLYNRNIAKGVQHQQILVAAYNYLRLASKGNIQKYIILWISTDGEMMSWDD